MPEGRAGLLHCVRAGGRRAGRPLASMVPAEDCVLRKRQPTRIGPANQRRRFLPPGEIRLCRAILVGCSWPDAGVQRKRQPTRIGSTNQKRRFLPPPGEIRLCRAHPGRLLLAGCRGPAPKAADQGRLYKAGVGWVDLLPGQQIGPREQQIAIPEQQIALPEEQIGIREEQIGIREEQIGLREEQIGLREEQIGLREEQIGFR